MADCLTRMLDAAQGDILGTPSIEYLRKQMDQLGYAYVDAAKICQGPELLVTVARLDISEFDEAELVELTLPVRDDAGEGRSS